MRVVRKDCDIATFGLGKVMSGGVLILAAGTKGKRKIGKNCRLMVHSVVGTSHGSLFSLENEMEEVRWIQDRYTKALAKESNITEEYIREELFGKKMNVYLSAEEAVELGIADEII
jgi:ATP-dependent Clp protease protease subunit